MAVTKTHPIKSTLKAAIDYICNPDKTDGKLLVSSFGCTAETADIEFSWTRRHAIDKGTNLGRHLIQAFEPGEVTPEEAHRIGMELAREVLGGKYEFVLTTHIDRDHVHNHLIFNAVSFQDHRHYHSNKRSYHEIRRTSDRICKEHGLSVIVPGRNKGMSYIEHQAEQNGTSYKAKLRAAIDRLLPGCSDLEDLLRRLQREGYELKRGKYISARAPGQERFTRLKTLGADYAEEALTARIAGRPRPSRQPQQRTGKPSLLIDIQNNIKAQQSAGYKHWATIENLKRAAETLNFLTEHGIGSMEDLSERCDGAAAATARVKADLRATEKEMERLTLTMKHAATYRQLRPLYEEYRQSRDKEKFLRGHEGEIILFEAAARELKRLDAVPLPATKRLRAEMDELTARTDRPAIGISEGPAGGKGVRHPPSECGRLCWKSRGRPNRRGSGAANWNRDGCALCRTFQKPLGAVRFSRYNGDRNGGAANDREPRPSRTFSRRRFCPSPSPGCCTAFSNPPA